MSRPLNDRARDRERLSNLPPTDQLIVKERVEHSTEDEVGRAVKNAATSETEARCRSNITVPADITDAAKAEDYRNAVEIAGKANASDYTKTRPMDFAVMKADGAVAADELKELKGRAAALSIEEADFIAYMAKMLAYPFRTSAALMQDRSMLLIFLIVVLGVEAAAIIASSAKFYGLTSWPSLALVPFSCWYNTTVFAVGGLVGCFGGSVLVGWLARKFTPGKLTYATGLVLAVILFMTFATSLAAVRWYTLHTAAAGLETVASASEILIVSLGLVVAAIIAEALIRSRSILKDAAHEAAAKEAELAAEGTRLRDAIAKNNTVIDATAFRATLPDRRQSEFEAAAMSFAHRVAEGKQEVERRVENAVDTWHRLQLWSPEERRRLVAGSAYDTSDNGIVAAIAKSAPLMMLMIVVVNFAAGCTPPSPTHRQVLCDGTGSYHQAVCNTDTVSEAFMDWAAAGAMIPGSTFQIISSASEFGNVRVHTIAAPTQWDGQIDSAVLKWKYGALKSMLSDFSIPVDEAGSERVNKSDLFGALAVARREAVFPDSDFAELIMMTDGYAIGEGFNFEKEVPEDVGGALDDLSKDGVTIDTRPYDDVIVCGLHHVGGSAKTVRARDAFWATALQATVHTSCADIFAPVARRDGESSTDHTGEDTIDAR